MQINKITNISSIDSNIQNAKDEDKSFKDSLHDKKVVQEFSEFKVGEKGNLMGLSSDGTWIEVDTEPLGEYEIMYNKDGSIFQLGIGFYRDFFNRFEDKSAFTVQNDRGFSSLDNSLALIPGKIANLPDGTTLRWTTNKVECIPRKANPNESAMAMKYAGSLANIMNLFTRIANGQRYGIGRPIGITKEETKNINTVLTAMGINTNRDFYVNGKKFTFDRASGQFKYTFDSSSDGKYSVRYVNTPTIKLV